MLLLLRCPGCSKPLKVKDELAGKKVKCPYCGLPVPVPRSAPDAAERPVLDVEELLEPAPWSPKTRPAAKTTPAPELVEEMEFAESDTGDERPRKSAKNDPQWVPCPRCGSREAKRVKSTFWGASLGPKLFNHVRCQDCRTTFNGKTGGSNLLPALGCVALFFLSLLFIAAALGVLIYIKRFGSVRDADEPPKRSEVIRRLDVSLSARSNSSAPASVLAQRGAATGW